MPNRSGIIQPDIDTNYAPDPVFPYGESIVTGGLENARSMINGLGLVTRGLLWQLYDVWFDQSFYDGLSTSWTNSNASITTTWTPAQYGTFGEYSP